MGVDNLLSFVKSATTDTHLDDIGLKNATAAVDISHWIYKACYACPEAIYLRTNVNQIYSTVTNYIDNYVKLLNFYNVKITFVFDGMRLPAKRKTHEERSARKAENKKLVEKFLARNNKTEARKFMLRCIEVKFDIIQQVIGYCKRKSISYIIAPYEADAQIAFLNNNKLAKFVITEDTDLILYGCERIIYKLDHTSGKCLLYEKSKLHKCLGPAHSGDADCNKLDFEKFRRICILSGCDYLKNIPNVGLQSAKKFFLLTKQDDMRVLLPKLSTYLKSARLVGKVTQEYINGFIDAENVFKHHIIYDTIKDKIAPLEPYPTGKTAADFPLAGKSFCNIQAKDLIMGRINLDSLNPDTDLDKAGEKEGEESEHERQDAEEEENNVNEESYFTAKEEDEEEELREDEEDELEEKNTFKRQKLEHKSAGLKNLPIQLSNCN